MAVEFRLGHRHLSGRKPHLQRRYPGDGGLGGSQGRVVVVGVAADIVSGLRGPARFAYSSGGEVCPGERSQRKREEQNVGGLIPLSDASRRAVRTPVCTALIILVNVVVF